MSAASTQAENFAVLLLPFKDPPNVSDLVKQVVVSDIEDGNDSSFDSSPSDGAEEDGAAEEDGEAKEDGEAEADDNSRYSGLRYKKDNTNQSNVFLACRFLSGRLPGLMFPRNNSTEKFSVARSSHSFKALIKELRRQGPTLKQATALALHSMYERVVKQYGQLDAVLKIETGGLYEHKLTRLAEYAKLIYDLHNDFVAHKFRTIAERKLAQEHEAEGQEVINTAAVQGSMLTLGARQAMSRKEREEADASPAAISSSSIAATSSIALPRPMSAPIPANIATAAMSTESSMDSASKSLLDMQHQLHVAVQATSDKYDSMISRQDSLEAQFTTQFPDVIYMLNRLEQTLKGMKTTLSDLKDDMDDMRREVRGVKRINESLESTIEDIQKDVRDIKRRKH